MFEDSLKGAVRINHNIFNNFKQNRLECSHELLESWQDAYALTTLAPSPSRNYLFQL